MYVYFTHNLTGKTERNRRKLLTCGTIMWCINEMYKVKYIRSVVIILSCNVPSVELPQGEEKVLVFKLAKTSIFLLSTQDQLKANVVSYTPLRRFTYFTRIVMPMVCKSFNTVSGHGHLGQQLGKLLYNIFLILSSFRFFSSAPNTAVGVRRPFFRVCGKLPLCPVAIRI